MLKRLFLLSAVREIAAEPAARLPKTPRDLQPAQPESS